MVKLGLSITEDEVTLENDVPDLEADVEDGGEMEKVD